MEKIPLDTLHNTQYHVIDFIMFMISSFNYITNKSLSTVTFSTKGIGKIILNFDSNKSHGYDNIRIRMLKMFGNPIFIPLVMIFKQALLIGGFPSERKKVNIVPIHKKNDNHIKNYWPVSLFRFVVTHLKDSYLMTLFIYFSANKLISQNQSGVQPNDSCINQL